MNSTLPRLGQRYGQDVWYLKNGTLFVERGSRVLKAQSIKRAGITPKVPSLTAAVEGIAECYRIGPVMGTDPEFFITKAGSIVPAFDHLPDKHGSGDGLFWDGFQAETTVEPPWLYDRANGTLELAHSVGDQLRKLTKKGLNIAPQSVWHVPKDMLQFAADAHVALGCDPSRNAYAVEGRRVLEPRRLEWRFAGGHVHFSLSSWERDRNLVRYLVKTLDAGLGIPSVCLAQNYDHFIRRRYYGLAGEYRLPLHGLEYRTLSNYWLIDPVAFALTFDLARHVLNLGRARLRSIFVGSERAIQDTINYCDVRSAKDFMRLNREFYTAWSQLCYGDSKAFWEAINGGVDKLVTRWGQDVIGAWEGV